MVDLVELKFSLIVDLDEECCICIVMVKMCMSGCIEDMNY